MNTKCFASISLVFEDDAISELVSSGGIGFLTAAAAAARAFREEQRRKWK